MNLLDRLWEAYQERPFLSNTLQSRLDLSHEDLSILLNTLADMADNGKARAGYRAFRIATTTYKLKKANAAQSTQECGDSLKGLPLTPPKESLVGANTAVFDDQLPENAENSINDPLPAVPSELKGRPQWVVWRQETRKGKPTKVPYQPTGKKAQSNEPNTWTAYRETLSHRDRFSGIGFVFSEADPYCGIDLDDCIDEHGKLKAWATPIVDRLKVVSYGEKSPSGNGIKFWTRATLPPDAKHKFYFVKGADAIEAYDNGRYFTVTGRGKGTIDDGQAAIDWLVEAHLTEKPTEPTPPLPRSAPTNNLNADEVIAQIRTSKQAAKFDRLMSGNTSDHGSHSEADCGLCGVIAFWTKDPALIDSIFRSSRLMRDKWDEQHRADGATYGQMTIAKALSEQRETYTPPKRRYSPTKARLNQTRQTLGGYR